MKRTRTQKYLTVPNEMEQYNMINWNNAIIPTYNLTKNETSISLYVNNTGDLIISGNVEETDYIFWLSFTKTDDLEMNERIFNHIANDEMERVSRMYKVLAHHEIPYAVLEEYYMVSLRKSGNKEMAWETPFGHCYGKSQIERNGHFFAKDVKNFVKEVHKRCELRECGGRYEEILRGYIELLENAETYTPDVRKLEALLKAEDYLCISETETVRTLYKKCCKRCSELYNHYMSLAR